MLHMICMSLRFWSTNSLWNLWSRDFKLLEYAILVQVLQYFGPFEHLNIDQKCTFEQFINPEKVGGPKSQRLAYAFTWLSPSYTWTKNYTPAINNTFIAIELNPFYLCYSTLRIHPRARIKYYPRIEKIVR